MAEQTAKSNQQQRLKYTFSYVLITFILSKFMMCNKTKTTFVNSCSDKKEKKPIKAPKQVENVVNEVKKCFHKSQSVKELSEGRKQYLKVTQLIENDRVCTICFLNKTNIKTAL